VPPKLSLQTLVHVEDNRANGAIREGLVEPENEFPLMQVRERATVRGAAVINSTTVLRQEWTGKKPEDITFPLPI
jgi:hypothetical protein